MMIAEQLETKYFDEILTSFCSATGLHTEAVNNDGNTIFIPSSVKRCNFCKIIRSSPQGEAKCRESYRQASIEAAKWEQPYFFRCHAGLVIWAIPIIIKDEVVGSIICGQVLLWKPDEFFFQEIEFLNANNPDIQQLKEAALQLEVVSAERTQAAADMLFVVVSHITKRNDRILDEMEAFRQLQQQIRTELEERKKYQTRHYTYDVYLKRERNLLRYIRLGDRRRADKALEILLTDLVNVSQGKIEEIRVRVLELASVVSRAAVEGGADAERAMKVLQDFQAEVNKYGKADELFYQAKRIVGEFLQDIFVLTDKKHLSLIKRAREYIMENYNQPMKVEDVSAHLFISPSHLSRLFRQELNCTFLEYLTRVRVEEAVNLMKRSELSIEQVAKRVGLKNQSYFAKVFKKYIGVTPLVYRNSLF